MSASRASALTKNLGSRGLAPTYYTMTSSPLGTITLTSDGRALTGLYLEHQRHQPTPDGTWIRDPAGFETVVRELAEYFEGVRTSFSVALAPMGTPFQQRVWQALLTIPYGETRSYKDIAAAIQKPAAMRAVGAANGKNPISLIIPCHRVIGRTGSLVGYGGGLDRKRWLLDLEQRYSRTAE